MPINSFALLRQTISLSKFPTRETRGLILDLVDALEQADNDRLDSQLDDYQAVSESCLVLQEHLVSLLQEDFAESENMHTQGVEIEDDIEREET